MKLKSVTLKNTRNFEESTFVFNGDEEIRMPNKGGKSTIADAITFLFIGKLYSGASDAASLKPIKDTSQEVEITAELEAADGRNIELKKTYKENWVKTRGTNDVEMKGHVTTCYIDDKKLTVSNYESELCSLFNVKNTKEINIMLNPYYFSQVLSWQERLEYVQQVTGKITPEDVMECAPDTKEIEDDLKKYNVEDLGKKYKRIMSDKKEIVRDLKIQLKGDEVEIVINKKEYDQAQKQYDDNLSKITNLKVEAKGVKNPTLEALKEQRDKIKDDLDKSKEMDREELAAKNSTINKEIDKLRDKRQEQAKLRDQVDNEIYGMKKDVSIEEGKIRTSERTLSLKEAERKRLIDSHKEWSNKQYEPEEKHECPNCGFDLTAEENKERELTFNELKAEKLKSISSNGKQIFNEITEAKKDIEEARDQINMLNETIEAKKDEVEEYKQKIQKLNQEIEQLEAKKVYTYQSDLTKELKTKLEAVDENIEKERNKAYDDGGIQKQIDDLTEENKALKETINKYDAQQVLINRRKAREKELIEATDELSQAEYNEDMLKLYTKTYLEILNTKLEQHFPGIEFMMVEENIKADSWNQTCYVMVEAEQGLVPYETANTESKIKIGVKLANHLAESLQWEKAPMVIDNAEAITDSNRKFETDAQTIVLIASEEKTYKYNNGVDPEQQSLEI